MLQHKHKSPTYLLHIVSGQFRVRIDARDINLSKYGTSESCAAYDRVINEWKLTGRGTGPNNMPAGTTIDELIPAYLAFASTFYVMNGALTSSSTYADQDR